MPQYLLQFAYTAETWAALSKNPVDRTEGISALAKKFGGRLIGLHYTMGDYDGVVLCDMPDDVTAMALAVAAVAPGHLRSTKTTRLFSAAEMVEALRKSHGAGYQAPKG